MATNSIIRSDSQHYSPSILLCPFCHINIPYLTISSSEAELSLCVKCPCSKENQYISIEKYIEQTVNLPNHQCFKNLHWNKKAEKYCPTCFKWLCKKCIGDHDDFERGHTLIDSEVSILCLKHKKPYADYCEKCDIHLCSECKMSHINMKHKLTGLNAEGIPIINMNDIDGIIKRNEQYTNELIVTIDSGIKRLNQMKQDLRSVYKDNDKANQYLKEMYKRLTLTLFKFKQTPVYQIIRMLQTIKLNAKTYNEEDKQSIEERYEQLKEYLQTNYILTQNNLVSPTNEEMVLTGHSEMISSLIQLNDGRLASSSSDTTIRIWKPTFNECEFTLMGHTNMIPCIIQLKDNRLASASYDKTIKLWDVTFNKWKGTLQGHNDRVWIIIQLIDSRLASGSYDKSIKLWDLSSNTCKATFFGHTDLIYSLIQLKNTRLASGSYDCTIRLWNTSQNSQSHLLKGHNDIITCIIQLKNNRLASSSSDNCIKIWNVNTNECDATLMSNTIQSYLLQLDEDRLASASCDNSIKIWDLRSNKLITALKGHNDTVERLLLINDGRLASCSRDNSIKLWNVNVNTNLYECIDTLTGHCSPITSLIQLNDYTLASSSNDKTIRLWTI